MKFKELQDYLNDQSDKYNNPAFIDDDPISVPHRFTLPQDIEISGLFSAIFAWGQRKTIIRKSLELMDRMDMEPYAFVKDSGKSDLNKLKGFKHRTFNETDLLYFVDFLKTLYKRTHSLEEAFTGMINFSKSRISEDNEATLNNGLKYYPKYGRSMKTMLEVFHKNFFSLDNFPERTRKHISSPAKNSTCKRINMYLRWMVRKDNKGVDFGLWKKISPAQLLCPLDLHVNKKARNLGLLSRHKTDFLSVIELTDNLLKMDKNDPVKYDFALFGLSMYEDANIQFPEMRKIDDNL